MSSRWIMSSSDKYQEEKPETCPETRSPSYSTAIVRPLLNKPHRHSAPTLFRGGWRRRPSSSVTGQAVATGDNSLKGPLGLNILFEPSETRVDFIFVHGLQGGSRKTWSLRPEDASTCWPEQWLPYEPGFKHVRVHSFGYDSDWSQIQHSAIRIRDFAESLLANIAHSQLLKKTRDVPIVFVAHSMGGLIIKQTYLLAKQQSIYQELLPRFHSMYFLGTPHRGSNFAAYLKHYLSLPMSQGAKEYVKELLPGSNTVRDINEDFRHVCKDLALWSFHEAVPTAGFYIVDKESAVMGLQGERVEMIHADHRHVCKFHTTTDTNYRMLVDRFKTTIELVDQDCATRQNTQMKSIARALNVPQSLQNDLLGVSEKCHRGTCQWITQNESFHRWLDFDIDHDDEDVDPLDTSKLNQKPPRFLWLNGAPGSGKSVVSGHVIKYLQSYNLDCSYFFFKNDAKATITQMLLSLAYQMTECNFEARQNFLFMIQNGDEVNTQDHTVIWNTLFLGRLFKIQYPQPHFWVIDALDECGKKSLVSLVQKFSKIEPSVPLRIFLTSRPDSPEAPVEQLLNEERIQRLELHTGQEESMKDIAAYIRSRPRLSRLLDDNDSSEKIVSSILERSRGIFLWASLMVDRLDSLYSLEDMQKALDQVPSEMNGFYGKILEGISNSANADKANCILRWVVCAPVPMKIDELKEAIRLDIGHTLLVSTSGDIFAEICRNLVKTGHNSEINFMHQTVREYLTSWASNLYIDHRAGHADIAAICLKFLNSQAFARHTTRRKNQGSVRQGSSSFAEYASLNFAYHLRHSQSKSSKLFSAFVDFINNKSLIWIEKISRLGKLAPFITSIQNLQRHLVRQLERSPPFDDQIQMVNTWVADLTRLVTIFGPTLIECPESIYAFIPALSPTSSVIHRTFAAASSQKVVSGSHDSWDERLSCVLFPSVVKSVASREQQLAVGLSNGTIRLLSTLTLEHLTTMEHGEAVRQVAFGNITNLLASLSPRKLVLWDARYKRIWQKQIKSTAFSVSFNANDSKVFVTLKGNVKQAVLTFSTSDGEQLDSLSIIEDRSDSDSDDHHESLDRFCPEVVRFSPVLGYAAVTYRSSHLTLFDLNEEDKLERLFRIEKKGSEKLRPPQILDVVFNPAVESGLMAVAYQDGDIIVIYFDEDRWYQVGSVSLHSRVLASSPDGMILAAGDTEGGVSLFNFDSLQLIHRLECLEEIVVGIIFSSNTLRLYDVRGRSCNVWEPSVLVRQNATDDTSSDQDDIPGESHLQSPVTRPFDEAKFVTVLTPMGDDKHVFCGREDGSVSIHDVRDGSKIVEFKRHSASIRVVEWNSKVNLLVSVDASTRCIGMRISPHLKHHNPWYQQDLVFNSRASSSVSQAIIEPNGLAVLFSTQRGEELWQNKTPPEPFSASQLSTETSQWMQHPTDKSLLLLFEQSTVRPFRWDDLSSIAFTSSVSMVLPPALKDTTLTNQWFSRVDFSSIVQAFHLQAENQNTFLLLASSNIHTASKQVPVSCTTSSFLGSVKAIVGVTRSAVIFLTRSGWISSFSLKSFEQAKFYTQHLFIPSFWRTGDLLIRTVSKDSVAIAYRDEVIIIRGFLDFDKKVEWH
ncbi:uncharacterized protein BDZ83DRAFT_630998 [Colletotrichum acutatum]|uniref:GPI inositol-deacylase n=1 Tax=Glomerella acutata TaxID=27357 RepID=A0AAD8UHQ0_GLOAC|nr:uncharacterized protein BDZ83DRAFT_630998 [Colletotrichum acutatum]KAK1720292.1 hypothetical protein BDZ83DRAFT_630998 [Colletotrichum acutatum]